jgi:protein-L-isoaspartate(D-aspartate) O-methyltransferase
VEQLTDNGILLLPLGPHSGAQQIVKLRKTAAGISREDMLPVRFVPLLAGQAREL